MAIVCEKKHSFTSGENFGSAEKCVSKFYNISLYNLNQYFQFKKFAYEKATCSFLTCKNDTEITSVHYF